MSDPYKILGVSRDATDDEIKKAYRSLSRKYHPDANVGAPNAKEIEEKFKEIQQAYHQIMDERERGTSGSSSYGSGNAWGGQSYSGNSTRLQAAANYINSRHFQEALNVLNDIEEHDAQWYFLSAVANAGLGNNVTARELASQAVALDPNNMQYRQFLAQLQNGGSWYSSMGNAYDSPVSGGNWCMRMCLLNLFCNCCCRPF